MRTLPSIDDTEATAQSESVTTGAAGSQASRPTSSPFGKSTERITGMVPPEIKEAFAQKARLLGYPSESDCARELFIIFSIGAESLAKIHADRIAAVAQNLVGIAP